jgi:hypothetical protein
MPTGRRHRRGKRSLLRRIADLELKASPDSIGDRDTAEEPEGGDRVHAD